MATPAYYYTNTFAENTVGNTGGISSSATSFFCAVTPSALPPGYPFKLSLDPGTSTEEVVKVTAGSGTLASPFTVVRGWDGTAQAAHAQGANVIHAATAEDFTNAASHAAQDSTTALPHGLPAAAWLATSLAVINETTISGSSTSVVTWSAIPSQYANLLIVVLARGSSTGVFTSNVNATVNGDASAVYADASWTTANNGSGMGAFTVSQEFTQTQWTMLAIPGSQAGSAVQMGGGFSVLPNYSGSAVNKNFYALSGHGTGTGQRTANWVRWGFYNPSSQSAITTLSLSVGSGNYVAGSFFGLYAFGG